MSDQWYYVDGGETRGPHSRSELKGLAQAGTLKSTTLVWKDGMEDWVPASTFGLNNGPPPVKPLPSPKSPPPAPPPVSQAVAALPPPPSRLTSPPPRPVSRPFPQSSQQTGIVIAAGIALVAGLAIGWLGHAMLVQPREKQIAAVPTPTPKVTSASRPLKGINNEVPKAIPPAVAAKPETPLAPPVSAPPTSVAPVTPVAPPPAATLPAEPSPAGPSSSAEAGPATTTNPPPAAPAATSPSTPAGSLATSQPSRSQLPPTQTLYQEIDVQRASKMPILNVVSETRYQILSELKVGDPDSEGIRTVGQAVLETRLAKADPLSQANYEEALKKLKGWQFSYTLARDGEVLKMAAGPADAPMVAKVEPMGNKGFLVTSVMDEAGWKELAQMSFYVPDVQASGNKRQVRQMTHDLGPLGSFAGETTFVRKGTQQGLLRIDYGHKLTYRPPAAAAAIGGSELTVSGADLRPDVAGGSIWYDQKTKRVRQAEDHFHVKGEIATNITALPVEEQQMMVVKLTDINPWSK